MAEIYLGNNQIGGGTVDLSNYIDTSTFAEATQVTAAAFHDLKRITFIHAKYILDCSTYDSSLTYHVNTLYDRINTKSDASTVYTKKEIDTDNKVVAAALASINSRVSSIESSIGSGISSDSSVDLTGFVYLDNNDRLVKEGGAS